MSFKAPNVEVLHVFTISCFQVVKFSSQQFGGVTQSRRLPLTQPFFPTKSLFSGRECYVTLTFQMIVSFISRLIVK